MGKIDEIVKLSLEDNLSIDKDLSFGYLHNYKAQEISAKTSIDCKGSDIVITAYDIAHIFKRHGNNVEEKKRGQIGVVKDDFSLIKNIVFNYDSVDKGNPIRNAKSLVFKKRIKHEYTIIAAIEGKVPNRKMVVKTMFKKP